MIIEQRQSVNGKKTYYRFKWGSSSGEKIGAGIFTYTKPKTKAEKNHNKEALTILEIKKSQLLIDRQSVGTGFIPVHRYKNNFLDFYDNFVEKNVRDGKRHLATSFVHFKTFIAKNSLPPIEVTEELCQRFRNHLLDNFNGDTPMNYFSEFKRMIKAATKQGYFRINPAEDVKAKAGKNRKLKENLEVEEYLKLLKTPCFNEEVREAFILCCYTGLRWADVHQLNWTDIGIDTIKTRIIQAKTGLPVIITMHPIAKTILDEKDLPGKAQKISRKYLLSTNCGWRKQSPQSLDCIC